MTINCCKQSLHLLHLSCTCCQLTRFDVHSLSPVFSFQLLQHLFVQMTDACDKVIATTIPTAPVPIVAKSKTSTTGTSAITAASGVPALVDIDDRTTAIGTKRFACKYFNLGGCRSNADCKFGHFVDASVLNEKDCPRENCKGKCKPGYEICPRCNREDNGEDVSSYRSKPQSSRGGYSSQTDRYSRGGGNTSRGRGRGNSSNTSTSTGYHRNSSRQDPPPKWASASDVAATNSWSRGAPTVVTPVTIVTPIQTVLAKSAKTVLVATPVTGAGVIAAAAPLVLKPVTSISKPVAEKPHTISVVPPGFAPLIPKPATVAKSTDWAEVEDDPVPMPVPAQAQASAISTLTKSSTPYQKYQLPKGGRVIRPPASNASNAPIPIVASTSTSTSTNATSAAESIHVCQKCCHVTMPPVAPRTKCADHQHSYYSVPIF